MYYETGEYSNFALLVVGAVTGLLGLENLDLLLGIILKCTSLISFGCFLLINRVKIKDGWKSFRASLKKKK
jgi:hypothetical protein